jgi:hypothetical protein
MCPMTDDEIIRIDPNEMENMLNDEAIKKRPMKKPTEHKKKMEPSDNDSAEEPGENTNIDAVLEESEEDSRTKTKKATKQRLQSEKRDSDAEIRQLFGALDSFIQKATIKSITKTLKNLQQYLDHDSSISNSESDHEEHGNK